MTIKYLIQREDRQYIMDSVPDWAVLPEYKVTKLSSAITTETVEKAIEDVQILQELYELEEQQIAQLKERLENALELVEVIYEFTSRDHASLLEAKGTLKLVADSCAKWLKPKV